MISLTDAGGGKEAATGVTVGGEDTTLQGGGQVAHVMVNTSDGQIEENGTDFACVARNLTSNRTCGYIISFSIIYYI